MKIFSIFIIFSLFLNASTDNIKKGQNIFQNQNEDVVIIQEEDTRKLFEDQSKAYIKKLLRTKNPSSLSLNLTRKYYKNHKYKTFFVNENGIKQLSTDLLEIIKDDQVIAPIINKYFNIEGIDSQIELLKSDSNNIQELVNLDFMLVSTYHTYMRLLSKGIIKWDEFQEDLKELDEKEEIIANWKKYSARVHIRNYLYKAVKKDDINIAINEVNYTFPKAKVLASLIKKYEDIIENGGYTKIPSVKKSLKKMNYYPEIPYLRQRLYQSGDLSSTDCFTKDIINEKGDLKDCKEFFDDELFNAVKSFQKRHGLVKDGIVGKNTIKRLNIPLEKKIEKIRINLERMRWMPRKLGEKYVLVNIPDYNLKMFKEGEKKLEMAVVVGERKHPTPIFSHKISTVVLNPYWRIPQRIVRREIIPKLVEDPTYLEKNDIKAFENWSHKSMEYDVSAVDWSMYLDNELIGTSKSAPMRFIQIPGDKNPLGRMKFLFPNKYSVYLHDTPAKSLFKNTRRAYSHGCIRLAEPHKLLETIANEDKNFKIEEVKEVLSEIEKKDLDLKKKIPVHIVYLTSWVDEDGKIQFRDDIYNYDKMQKKYIYTN